jgi:phosphoesterase RecJ-like protein
MTMNASFEQIGGIFSQYDSFVILSHVRPDGDAIGSQIALGFALMAAGKKVRLINEDGVPENLAFMLGCDRVETPPDEPLDVEVAIALDTASKVRLGERALNAASKAKVWLNIDHHISNPGYGDVNRIDGTSPATGQILYQLIKALNLPLTPESRDAIYVAVSTDTGSFQYPGTTAETYDMASDLIRQGLDLGRINRLIYDSYPFRRVELMRALLNTLECNNDHRVAHWDLTMATREALNLKPEDSEGLIDIIRAIDTVLVAVFFEELPDGKIRVSMRSKDTRFNASKVCGTFGGGGHALAAGIRMAGPIEDAKVRVLAAIDAELQTF